MAEDRVPRTEPLWFHPPVTMITAPNPGPMTLTGTHAYAVGQSEAYLIDPGPHMPSYLRELERWLRAHVPGLQGILLTHGHPDHAPGAAALAVSLGLPIMTSDLMPQAERATLGVTSTFRAGDRFEVDRDTLSVIPTPGHTADHVSFWLERAAILFSGDTILGEGTTLIAPPEGNMAAYLRTLESVRKLRPAVIAPGHGPPVRDPEQKVDEYLRHRRQREEQLLTALTVRPASPEELVRKVYTDVGPELHALALGSVLAQLEKLEAEGRVVSRDGTYFLPRGDSA